MQIELDFTKESFSTLHEHLQGKDAIRGNAQLYLAQHCELQQLAKTENFYLRHDTLLPSVILSLDGHVLPVSLRNKGETVKSSYAYIMNSVFQITYRIFSPLICTKHSNLMAYT